MSVSGSASLTAQLEHLGWPGTETLVRDAVPAIVRGNNVVAVLPPSPAWADPVLAAAVSRAVETDSAVLLLTPPAILDEWVFAVGALLESSGTRIDVIDDRRDPAAPHQLAPLLIGTPEAALARHQASALHPERVGTIVLAWPEDWDDDDAVAALLHDMPRDAQRIVLTTRADQTAGGDIAERYARKATLVQPFDRANPTPAARAMITTTPTAWALRASATADLVAGMSGQRVTIWTADTRDHESLRRHVAVIDPSAQIQSRGAVRDRDTVICYDPPSHAQLEQLHAERVALLVPPGTARYVARIAPSRTPRDLSRVGAIVRARDARRRDQVVSTMAADTAAASYALEPLFERFDAQLVAAALYTLWTGTPAQTVAPAPPPTAAPAVPGSDRNLPAKLWVGAGKKDDATVADYVAILVREVGMDRSQIGRIELRDTFALVEVPALEAEAIATRLTGLTLRRRKLSARVDSRRAAQRGGP